MFTNMFFIWEEAKSFSFAPTNTFQWQMFKSLINAWWCCILTDLILESRSLTLILALPLTSMCLRKYLCFLLLFVTWVHNNYKIKIIYLILEYFLDILYLILECFLAQSCSDSLSYWGIQWYSESKKLKRLGIQQADASMPGGHGFKHPHFGKYTYWR